MDNFFYIYRSIDLLGSNIKLYLYQFLILFIITIFTNNLYGMAFL